MQPYEKNKRITGAQKKKRAKMAAENFDAKVARTHKDRTLPLSSMAGNRRESALLTALATIDADLDMLHAEKRMPIRSIMKRNLDAEYDGGKLWVVLKIVVEPNLNSG